MLFVFLQIDKQVDIEFVGYGPPEKINFTNLQDMATPNKAIQLKKDKHYKKKRPVDLREAVCGKNFVLINLPFTTKTVSMSIILIPPVDLTLTGFPTGIKVCMP